MTHQTGPADTVYGEVPVPYVMVGSQADGNIGIVVYKFVVAPGFVTGSDAAVTADLYLRGDPSDAGAQNIWIAQDSTLTTESNLTAIDNDVDFTKITMGDEFSGGFGSYFADGVTIPIAPGLSTFYVAFGDNLDNSTSSDRMAVSALSVDADPAVSPIPEPASLSIIAAGVGLLALRRRHRVI